MPSVRLILHHNHLAQKGTTSQPQHVLIRGQQYFLSRERNYFQFDAGDDCTADRERLLLACCRSETAAVWQRKRFLTSANMLPHRTEGRVKIPRTLKDEGFVFVDV